MPFTVLSIVFITNAINLIDGIDGLASGLSSVSLLIFTFLFIDKGLWSYAMLSVATFGVLVPFFYYNVFGSAERSRKIFMGDTGSMFFGGIVTALAFVMQRPELVLFFGIVYIWDAMTVVIQRAYFKATHGKRIFRMAPLHHHFEMGGWSEEKLFTVFTLVTLVCCVLAYFGVLGK